MTSASTSTINELIEELLELRRMGDSRIEQRNMEIRITIGRYDGRAQVIFLRYWEKFEYNCIFFKQNIHLFP